MRAVRRGGQDARGASSSGEGAGAGCPRCGSDHGRAAGARRPGTRARSGDGAPRVRAAASAVRMITVTTCVSPESETTRAAAGRRRRARRRRPPALAGRARATHGARWHARPARRSTRRAGRSLPTKTIDAIARLSCSVAIHQIRCAAGRMSRPPPPCRELVAEHPPDEDEHEAGHDQADRAARIARRRSGAIQTASAKIRMTTITINRRRCAGPGRLSARRRAGWSAAARSSRHSGGAFPRRGL